MGDDTRRSLKQKHVETNYAGIGYRYIRERTQCCAKFECRDIEIRKLSGEALNYITKLYCNDNGFDEIYRCFFFLNKQILTLDTK